MLSVTEQFTCAGHAWHNYILCIITTHLNPSKKKKKCGHVVMAYDGNKFPCSAEPDLLLKVICKICGLRTELSKWPGGIKSFLTEDKVARAKWRLWEKKMNGWKTHQEYDVFATWSTINKFFFFNGKVILFTFWMKQLQKLYVFSFTRSEELNQCFYSLPDYVFYTLTFTFITSAYSGDF